MEHIWNLIKLISSPWKTFDKKRMGRSIHTVFACIYAASLKVVWTQEELAQEHWYGFPMTLLALAVSLISFWALISGYHYWQQRHTAKVIQGLENVILPDTVNTHRERDDIYTSYRAVVAEVERLREGKDNQGEEEQDDLD